MSFALGEMVEEEWREFYRMPRPLCFNNVFVRNVFAVSGIMYFLHYKSLDTITDPSSCNLTT